MSLAWNPDLLIGNTQIDDQHKRIFQILDKLVQAEAEHRGKEEMGKALASASVFVAAHFKMEEDLMVQSGYAELPAHRNAHEAVRIRVDQLVDRFYRDELDPLELVNFMTWWLQQHVQRQDRPLAEFLRCRQQAGCPS
ncbi:MAG: bacteriohemerythrin [Holophaga sp.]|nr:bacteriohemerythrin [Holophaga sp.]